MIVSTVGEAHDKIPDNVVDKVRIVASVSNMTKYIYPGQPHAQPGNSKALCCIVPELLANTIRKDVKSIGRLGGSVG